MPNPSSRSDVFRFGVFELNAAAGELRKAGVRIRLPGQPFQVLQLLVERANEVVTRDELRHRLWADNTFVDYDLALKKAVNRLRQVLGDSVDSPRFIETIPRRGYRFIAPVQCDSAKSSDAVLPEPAVAATRFPVRRTAIVIGLVLVLVLAIWLLNWRRRPVIGSPSRIHSLVVLPLDNLSGDPSQEYLADGLTDVLTTDLAQLPSVRVISRTSAYAVKTGKRPTADIQKSLGVDAIVEGSVVRSRNRIRVDAQLVDAFTDRHLWAHSFEGDSNDILTLQDQVSRAVAEQIQVALAPAPQAQALNRHVPTAPAYDSYLRGLYAIDQRNLSSFVAARKYFEQVTQQDPNWADGFSGLAASYALLSDYNYLAPEDGWPKAKQAAVRALALDSSLPQAHNVLAFARWHYDWDWSGADNEFRAAIQLNSNYAPAHHWYGLFLASHRRFADANQQFQIARSSDPLSLIIQTNEGWAAYFQRDFPRALAICQYVLKTDPSFGPAHGKLWPLYAVQHDQTKAISELQQLARFYGNTAMVDILSRNYSHSGFDTAVLAAIHQQEELAKQSYMSPYSFAEQYVLVGDKPRALQYLGEAERRRDGWLVYVKVEPIFDPIRSDPEFVRIADRVVPE